MTATPHPAHQILVETGRTLAAIAEPHRDLIAFALDLGEIAETLKLLGIGLEKADDRAEERFDALFLQDRFDAARAAGDSERRQARATAIRTAKRALVNLSRVIAEMEAAGADPNGEG